MGLEIGCGTHADMARPTGGRFSVILETETTLKILLAAYHLSHHDRTDRHRGVWGTFALLISSLQK